MLENLKKEMEKKGVKNKDIARILGIKSPAVSKRLYGSVKLHDDEKDKIANLLEIKDQEYLFKDTGYTPPKKENTETIFSKRFSVLLKLDGRTQKEIANLLDVNERTVSDWKSGKQSTSINMLKKISDTLDVNVSFLTGESSGIYPSCTNVLDDRKKKDEEIVKTIAMALDSFLDIKGIKYEKIKYYRDNKLGHIIKNDEEIKKLRIDKELTTDDKQYNEICCLIKNRKEEIKSFYFKVRFFYSDLPYKLLDIFKENFDSEYNKDDVGELNRLKWLMAFSTRALLDLENVYSRLLDMDFNEWRKKYICYDNELQGERPCYDRGIFSFFKYNGSFKDRESLIAYLEKEIKHHKDKLSTVNEELRTFEN